MGILKSIESNTRQHLNIVNYTYVCEAYGVVSPAKILQNPKLGSECKESIALFYLKNPNLKHYTASKLYLMQMYHLEFKRRGCLLFARGKRSLSELLLREGLAIVEPGFKDREYESLFEYAQKNARIEAKGIWRENSLVSCLGGLYD